MKRNKFVIGILICTCLCLLLSACGEHLNAAQKEYKAAAEKQLEASLAEYDEKIEEAEELEKRVNNLKSLEDKVQLMLDADLISKDEADSITSQGIKQRLEENVEYEKNLKKSFKENYEESIQKTLDQMG